MKKVFLDAREFALPVPREGSIETNSGYGAPPLNGQEIHLIIQKKRKKEWSDYTAEKKLSRTFEKSPYAFIISGRVDGFKENFKENLKEGSIPLLEEIKTAFDIDELFHKLKNTSNHPYILQLKTYGYIYYLNHNILPDLQLLLVSSRHYRTKNFPVKLDLQSYESWLEKRLEELVAETKVKERLFLKRQKNAESLIFPFDKPRPGQEELIAGVEDHFSRNIPLLVQAPTGLGKTAGILYPALKESLSRGQKVVYVTPKNSQHQVAEEAVKLMQATGSKIKSLTLTAKSKMCLKDEQHCNPDYCEYSRDYYQKLARLDLVSLINKKKKLSSKNLKDLGKMHEVCPFELSLEAIENADVVIADYNYVFSPRSLIGKLSTPLIEKKEKPNLIIDEAHNLPSRAQEYFSASLSVTQLKSFKTSGVELAGEALGLIQTYAGSARKVEIDPEPFLVLDKKIREFTMSYLDSEKEISAHDPVLAFSNTFSSFVDALESKGPEYFQTYQKNYSDEWLKITCCDASKELQKAYKEFKNSIAFSATLKPFRYYHELLGFSDHTEMLEFNSPFKRENRKLMVIPQVSTKFKDRKENVQKIREIIQRVSQIKKGNYLLLFPSFDFLQMVMHDFKVDNFNVLIQPREIKSSAAKLILETLKEAKAPTLLAAVQGGVFAEGVDYPGEMLIGAFIIGPALPHFDFEREQIRSYYEQRYGNENAFDYAYVYPAMARAIQSAGRVIRTETDRGIILLLDQRFLEKSYAQTMPSEWFDENPFELISQKILQEINEFWSSHEKH